MTKLKKMHRNTESWPNLKKNTFKERVLSFHLNSRILTQKRLSH